MKKAGLGAVAVSVIVILSFSIFFGLQSVHASSPTVKTVSIPNSGTAFAGMVLSSGTLYYASYQYGAIYTVPTATMNSYATLSPPVASFDRIFFGLAMDGSGNLWATRRDAANNGTGPGISLISTSTGKIYNILTGTGEWDGTGYSNGYVYAAQGSTFYQVSTTSPYAVTTYPITGGGGSYYGMVPDSLGDIWFTDILGNKLCDFNGASISCANGSGNGFTFSRPSGIEIDGAIMFVAENNLDGNIDRVSIPSGVITQQTATDGMPYGIIGVGPAATQSVIWSSAGTDDQICVLNGACVNTGATNYYLQADSSENVYFSFDGGNGVGQISGLVASATTSTTWNGATLTYANCAMTMQFGGSTDIVQDNCGGGSSSSTSASSSSGSCMSGSLTTPKYSAGQTFLASNGKCYMVQTETDGSLANVAGCSTSGWWYYTTSGAEVIDSACSGEWVPYAT